MKAVVLALAVTLVTSTAHANGRPPLTNGIFFKPGDAHSLYVRTTFGLLISHDDGCTMSWVCEQNIGYAGSYDPKYAIATDGTIYATSPAAGLRVSRDGGCTFTTHPSLPADSWTDAVDIGPTGEVWVVTATSGATNNVYSSVDAGTTFQARGMLSGTIWWKSVKVAHSNPMRIYVGGYEVAGTLADGGVGPLAHLAHSDDDGAHWTESPLAGVMYGGASPIVIVAAVDPQNADTVYVISVGANPPNGDRLYRSTDAGATLTEVLATTDGIRDVVVRDAQTVLVATQMGGSFVSTTAGQSFQPMASPPQLNCLGQREDGALIGCGANWTPDNMAVAKSADGGVSWQKVWRFVEMYGPLQCPAGTPEHDTCGDQLWPNLAASFACTGPACGALQGQVYGAGATTDTTPVKKKSGCCDASGGAAGGSVLCAGFVAFLLVRKRR